MENKTKQELQIMLKDAYKAIQDIDYNSIYSFFFIRNQEKRDELVEYVKKIELEIIYREDDEKRSNYTKIRSMDPLKNSRKKIFIDDIYQK
jgi:hypothetical protein